MTRTYPYFRFSKYHCPWEIAQCWMEHFERHNIPACILTNDAGYSIWRIGAEAMAYKRLHAGYQPNNERISGEIIVEVCGFSDKK